MSGGERGSRDLAALGVCLLFVGVAAALLVATANLEGTDGRLLFGMWRTRDVGLAGFLLLLSGGIACAQASRRAWMRFVFVGLQAGLALLLLEAAGLSGLVSYGQLFGNLGTVPTNDLGRRPVPHQDVRGETFMDTASAWGLPRQPIPFHYATDRYGFRNPKDPGTAEVYLLGDSIVVGGLVPFEETVTKQLELELGRSVMNVALIGISPQEEHAIFEASDLDVAGRLVLQFVFEGNDLGDSASYRLGLKPATNEVGLKARSFTQNAVLALQRLTQPTVGLAKKRTCEIGGQTYTFRWTTNSYLGLESEQAHVFTAIERFARRIEAAGGDFAAVFVPAKLRVVGPVCEAWPAQSDLRGAIDANPMRDGMLAWGETAHIPVIDLTEALQRSAREGAIPWFWGDTHWNARGHALAAQTLAQAGALQAWMNDRPAAASR